MHEVSHRFRVDFRPDLGTILRPMQRGRHDPTLRFGPDGVWRTTSTPDGSVTQHLTVAKDQVTSRCWGPGAEWMIARTPDLVGAGDHTATAFDPLPGAVADGWRRLAQRWRVPRGHNVWESAVAAVLEQKVTGLEAKRAWAALARGYGDAAPGPAPAGMRVFPSPAVVRLIPSWVWRRNAVDRSRSDTIMRLAGVPHVLTRLPDVPPAEARRLLTAIRGIGDWTYAEIAQRALGDADAVSVGDFHLAKDIVYSVTGEFDGTDDQLLQVLAPYEGHRYRAVRVFEMAGAQQPRRGPRFAIPAHRYG